MTYNLAGYDVKTGALSKWHNRLLFWRSDFDSQGFHEKTGTFYCEYGFDAVGRSKDGALNLMRPVYDAMNGKLTEDNLAEYVSAGQEHHAMNEVKLDAWDRTYNSAYVAPGKDGRLVTVFFYQYFDKSDDGWKTVVTTPVEVDAFPNPRRAVATFHWDSYLTVREAQRVVAESLTGVTV